LRGKKSACVLVGQCYRTYQGVREAEALGEVLEMQALEAR